MNRQLYEYSYELRKEKKQKTIFLVIFFLIIFIILNIIFSFLIYPVKQKSVSMKPDLPENSISFISKIDKTPERGDVFLLKNKADQNYKFYQKIWKSFSSFFTAKQYNYVSKPEYPGSYNELRRIVGMPGDEIYMRDYVVYIKPKGEKHFLTEFELIDCPYNLTFDIPPESWDNSIGVKGSFEAITLKDDEYFVLADNRLGSIDSRMWGPVSKSEFLGKLFITYFPISNFKFYN